MLIVFNVLRSPHENKADIVSAMVAWRKVFAVYAGDFVLRCVTRIVDNSIDSRLLYLLSGLMFVRHSCYSLSEGRPTLYHANEEP